MSSSFFSASNIYCRMLFYLSLNRFLQSLSVPDFKDLVRYSRSIFTILLTLSLLSIKYLELLSFRKCFLNTELWTFIQLLKALRYLSHFSWYFLLPYDWISLNPVSKFYFFFVLIRMHIKFMADSLALANTDDSWLMDWFLWSTKIFLRTWKDSYLWLYSDLLTRDKNTSNSLFFGRYVLRGLYFMFWKAWVKVLL